MPERLTLRRDFSEIERATTWMESIAAQSAWPKTLIFRLRLCLEEGISNVIRHGRAEGAASDIHVALEEKDQRVTASIEDDGQAFDPTQHPVLERASSIEGARVGGFGIHLMRRFATRLAYQRIGPRNRLVLMFDRT
jgi:anti-sigma regulatory factor (Ser/Thr protein kinase)